MNAFVDTNILVYAADETMQAERKRMIARELLRAPRLRISVQVLNEFVASARHPRKLALSQTAEQDWLAAWLRMTVTPLSLNLFVEALRIHLRYHFSHWDSLIVSAALASNSSILYSEDLQHGQVIEGMEIINPFREE
ncbi:MAG: PIN domain-containing protein [Akkermansiaceae bacterium]